jgi:hypothetical protein
VRHDDVRMCPVVVARATAERSSHTVTLHVSLKWIRHNFVMLDCALHTYPLVKHEMYFAEAGTGSDGSVRATSMTLSWCPSCCTL